MEQVVLILLPFLWSVLISLYAVPGVIDLAWNKGLMDTFESRKVHNKLTPRLGGVAIFAGTFSGIMIFAEVDHFMQYFLAALLILFFVGVIDDIQEIKAWKKLLIQLLATFLVIYEGEFYLSSFKGVFGIHIESDFALISLTTLYILAITNAINFIDGLDGLAASLSSLSSLLFAILLFQVAPSQGIALICLGGSLIGFLRYNLKKSTVFMGDAGSLISGFTLAVLSLKVVEFKTDASGFALAYAILFVPVTDFIRVLIMRVLRGKSPFQPGRDHIHHLIMDKGRSAKKVVAILVLVNTITAIAGILFTTILHFDPNSIIFVLIGTSLTLSIYCEFGLKKKNKSG